MDFVEEFEDSKALPPHIVATYTFFKDFSVNMEKGVVRWSIAEHEVGTEKAELFKNLLKYFTVENYVNDRLEWLNSESLHAEQSNDSTLDDFFA